MSDRQNKQKEPKTGGSDKKTIAHMRALSLRYRGVILTFILDILFCVAAFWITRFAMFKEVDYPLNYLNFEIPIMIIMVAVPVCLLALFNCYNVVWKFASRVEFIKFVAAYALAIAMLFVVKAILIASFNVVLWGTQIWLYSTVSLMLTALTRFSNMLIAYFKHVRGNISGEKASKTKQLRTVIYGAGNIGSVLNLSLIHI